MSNSSQISDEILSLAKTHLGRAQTDRAVLPDYGTRWDPQSKKINAAISSFVDSAQAVQYAQREITFDHRTSMAHEVPYIPLYDRELKAEMPWFTDALNSMADFAEGRPDSIGDYGGRKVSNAFYYHARIVLRCLFLTKNPNVILEVGGGYGAPAYQWLTNPVHRPDTYIIVDIPECLFFAEVALRRAFGDRVFYAGETKGWQGKGIYLVPLTRLDLLADTKIDLMVNTGSMQEMSDEWINFYMGWLDRQLPAYFYSLNYAAQPLDKLAESRTLWGPRPSKIWNLLLIEINQASMRMHTDRDYMETLYKNGSPVSGSAAHLRNYRITRQRYVEWLDAIRCGAPTTDSVELLRRVHDELGYWPKECLWIANELMATEYRSEFEKLRDELAALAGGYLYEAAIVRDNS